MHTIVIVERENYRNSMENIASRTAQKYEKTCYISFSDPYHIVIEMLQNANVDEKFIVVDATGNVKEITNPHKTAYVLPIEHLFDVYLFLKNLIIDENIKVLLVDSLSALIYKHNQLPLKQMLTNLLLEVGTLRCDSRLVVLKEHLNHEVITHLNPLIGNSIVM